MSIWRLLLLCLLAAFIPVKGMAAAVAMGCNSHHLPVQHSVAHGEHGPHAHAHPQGNSPAETVAAAHPTASADPSHTQCSACGSCCVGAALATMASLHVAGYGGQADFIEPTLAHSSPVLRGLERPPQSLAA